eukprot:RCo020730
MAVKVCSCTAPFAAHCTPWNRSGLSLLTTSALDFALDQETAHIHIHIHVHTEGERLASCILCTVCLQGRCMWVFLPPPLTLVPHVSSVQLLAPPQTFLASPPPHPTPP